jgi:hypothetical protein
MCIIVLFAEVAFYVLGCEFYSLFVLCDLNRWVNKLLNLMLIRSILRKLINRLGSLGRFTLFSMGLISL